MDQGNDPNDQSSLPKKTDIDTAGEGGEVEDKLQEMEGVQYPPECLSTDQPTQKAFTQTLSATEQNENVQQGPISVSQISIQVGEDTSHTYTSLSNQQDVEVGAEANEFIPKMDESNNPAEDTQNKSPTTMRAGGKHSTAKTDPLGVLQNAPHVGDKSEETLTYDNYFGQNDSAANDDKSTKAEFTDGDSQKKRDQNTVHSDSNATNVHKDYLSDANETPIQGAEKIHKLELHIAELEEKNKKLNVKNEDTEKELLRAAKEKVLAIEENRKSSEKCSNMEHLLDETLEKNQVLENNVKDKHNSLKKELNDWKKECSQMETKHQSLTNDVHKERKDKEDAISRLKQMDQKRKDTEAKLKQYQDAYPKLQTEKNSWESAYNEQLHNIQYLQQQCQLKDENNKRQHDKYQSLLQEKRSLEEERSTLVLRLSKIAGAKLTTANANIADLSDENRPTKVAEKFSELYDNEWTDAFEFISERFNNEEERGVTYMLDMLQFAFELCNEMSTGHLASIEKSATTICHTAQWVPKAAEGMKSNDNIMATAPLTSLKEVPATQQTQPHTDTVITIQPGSNNTEMANEADSHANELAEDYVHITHSDGATNSDEQEDNTSPMETDDVDAEIKAGCQENSTQTIQDNNNQADSDEPLRYDKHTQTSQEQDVVPVQAEIRDTQTDVDSGIKIPYEKPKVESVTFTVKNEALLTDEYKKQLFDMKKIIGFSLTELVQQELTTVICKRFDISTDIEDVVPKYIRKCIEICWYMGLQNPPVFMKFEEPSDGMQFDCNTYKPYTKTGKHIAYVVWPPLFLHKDGSMLSKGVAQGRK